MTAPPPITFAAAAAQAGAPLTPNQLAHFAAYRDLLLTWNTRINLTAIKSPTEVEHRLFLDALRLLPTLNTLLAPRSDPAPSTGAGNPDPAPSTGAVRLPPTAYRLIDIGTGAGFPGLPLKLARPDLHLTLVEATGKKATFLTRVTAELGLTGVTVLHARAEDLGHDPAHRSVYDVATARAVAALPALLELCMPLLRQGGHALFPKGTDLADELAAGRRAAPIVGARILSADPLPNSDTRLVVAAKTAPTPPRYPRRAGIPARDPLGRDRS